MLSINWGPGRKSIARGSKDPPEMSEEELIVERVETEVV